MKRYVMIPNNLIADQSLGDKRIIAYSSIFFSGFSGENINDLVLYAGYSLNRNQGKALSQFKELISMFVMHEYYTGDMVYIKPEKCFGVIYYSEFQRIIKKREQERQNGSRINHARLLLLLAHIRMCMLRQPELPEFYSNFLNRISESTGISVRSISSGVKVLEELHIIHSEELPRYKDRSGNWHSNVRIFVNMERNGKPDESYNWKQVLSQGIKYIMFQQNSL